MEKFEDAYWTAAAKVAFVLARPLTRVIAAVLTYLVTVTIGFVVPAAIGFGWTYLAFLATWLVALYSVTSYGLDALGDYQMEKMQREAREREG